ncbi:MAG TPA: hypothetical protein VN643_04415 [Pyrinomonadaceae bacterium]|nr:hypothetical protein [Pyrinomonadaceae bacterium]
MKHNQSHDKDSTDNTANTNEGQETRNASKAENRAADFGQAGKFAPGGYDIQQGKAKPDRVDLDEELAPRRQLGNRQ